MEIFKMTDIWHITWNTSTFLQKSNKNAIIENNEYPIINNLARYAQKICSNTKCIPTRLDNMVFHIIRSKLTYFK